MSIISRDDLVDWFKSVGHHDQIEAALREINFFKLLDLHFLNPEDELAFKLKFEMHEKFIDWDRVPVIVPYI